MIPIEPTNLGAEAASIIKHALAKGGTLSRLLLASHEIEDGSVYTFLPAGTSTEAANEFGSGGKVPPLPSEAPENFTSEGGARWRVSPVPNVDAYLAITIQHFLRAAQGRVCIFEDAVARPTDLRLASANTRVVVFDDEVYHWLAQEDSETASILNTIRQVRSWQIVAAMTSTQKVQDLTPDTRIISYDALKTMSEDAMTIIVGAYDSESYLIWNRAQG